MESADHEKTATSSKMDPHVKRQQAMGYKAEGRSLNPTKLNLGFINNKASGKFMDLRSSGPRLEERDVIKSNDLCVSASVEGEKSKGKKDSPSFSDRFRGKESPETSEVSPSSGGQPGNCSR